jgi:hypothetical protein
MRVLIDFLKINKQKYLYGLLKIKLPKLVRKGVKKYIIYVNIDKMVIFKTGKKGEKRINCRKR